jgi:hypothetical protein
MPPTNSNSVRRQRSQRASAERKDERMADESIADHVDVSEAVAKLDETITGLESEIERDENVLGVKRARLDALKRGRKGLEAATDPDIQPRKRPGRKPKDEAVAA